MADGHFPKSISLGKRALAWEISEIEDWVLAKIESRNKVIDELVEVKTEVEFSENDVIKFINKKFSQRSISDAITWLIQIYKQVK